MSHNHSHAHIDSNDEAMALLEYMAKHNESHTDELKNIANKLDFATDDARDILLSAIECYKNGNDLLAKAIKEIKGE